MKKITVILLVVFCVAILTACGASVSKTEAEADIGEVEAVEIEPEEAAEEAEESEPEHDWYEFGSGRYIAGVDFPNNKYIYIECTEGSGNLLVDSYEGTDREMIYMEEGDYGSIEIEENDGITIMPSDKGTVKVRILA